MRRRITVLGIGITGCILLLLIMPGLVKARSGPAGNACINNLRRIDGAKQTWALEHFGTNSHMNAAKIYPSWNNIQPYLGRGPKGSLPTCPNGGKYTIGNLEEAPKCSVPGHVIK